MKTSLLFKKLRQIVGGASLLPSEPEKTMADQCSSGKFLHRKTFQLSATGAGCSRHFFACNFAGVIIAFVLCQAVAIASCGISSYPPSTPCGKNDQFQYWETLGHIAVEEIEKTSGEKINSHIAIHLGYKPDRTFPSLFGQGWILPIFESHVRWQNADTAVLFLPDGMEETLKRENGKKQRLSNSIWSAEISGQKLIFQSSCGWGLTFVNNRIASMKTPEGIVLDIITGADRSQKLIHGKNTLLSLKPDYDAQNLPPDTCSTNLSL